MRLGRRIDALPVSGRDHHYQVGTVWTGNRGTGTSGYRDYDRTHTVKVQGKSDILGSSDPNFRGDRSRHNPEDLLVASLSTCHMLWRARRREGPRDYEIGRAHV